MGRSLSWDIQLILWLMDSGHRGFAAPRNDVGREFWANKKPGIVARIFHRRNRRGGGQHRRGRHTRESAGKEIAPVRVR